MRNKILLGLCVALVVSFLPALPFVNAAGGDYVATFEGDMPLLFAVGHGGWKQVGVQENGGYAADPR